MLLHFQNFSKFCNSYTPCFQSQKLYYFIIDVAALLASLALHISEVACSSLKVAYPIDHPSPDC